MNKIVFIGAGSVVFTRNLVSDLLSYPELDEISRMTDDLFAAHRPYLPQFPR